MRLTKLLLIPAILAAQAAFAGTVTVTDDTGREVTFEAPARDIVVTHEQVLGLPLLDLGLVPIAAYGRADDGSNLGAVDFVDVVFGKDAPRSPTGIGPIGNIDLEKLRSLNPDLIIGTEYDMARADQLTQTAPLYLASVDPSKSYGFGLEEDLADLLGLQDQFAARRKTFDEQLDAVKAKLGDTEGKTYLAIFLTDQINLVGNFSGMIQAIEGLGYTKAEVSKTEAITGNGKMLFVPISSEIFARLNPDLLVIMDSYTKLERGEEAIKAQLNKLVPGWDKFMKPVREGRVVYVDSVKVTTPTVASALNMLSAIGEWADRTN